MIYLDTAALVKLIRPEAEPRALVEWLESRPAERLAVCPAK